MKKLGSCYIPLLLLFFMFSSVMKSQSSMTSKDNWKPFNVHIDNSNTINGVAFFKKTITCNSKEVIVFKVVNLNAFVVNVTWNLKNNKTITVSIPANGNIGGSCETLNSSDNNDFQKTMTLIKEGATSEADLLPSVQVEATQPGK